MSKPKIEPDLELGIRIKKLRKAKKMKQAELADDVGLENYQMISRYETGRIAIPKNKQEKLAKALGVSVNMLFAPTEKQRAEEDKILSLAEEEYRADIASRRHDLAIFFNLLGFNFEYCEELEAYYAFRDICGLAEFNKMPETIRLGSGVNHISSNAEGSKIFDAYLSEIDIEEIIKTVQATTTALLISLKRRGALESENLSYKLSEEGNK